MTVTYHSGERIQGTSTDLAGIPAVSGGWKELDRTTLGSSGDTISVSSLDDKRYYMILGDISNTGGDTVSHVRANSDSSGNYALRREVNGTQETPSTGTNRFMTTHSSKSVNSRFIYGHIENKSDEEKLGIFHVNENSSTGSGVAPSRIEGVGKHVQTSNPINELQLFNDEAGSFDTGSELVVLGYDPDDTHTTNFWEQLTDKSWTSGNAITTDTFATKKYLWIQGWYTQSGTSGHNRFRVGNNTIDTGSNYSQRYSINGGTDVATGGASLNLNNLWAVVGQGSDAGIDRCFFNMFIINNGSNEKLITGHSVWSQTDGGGSAPERTEYACKWVNTSDQINIAEININGSGSFSGGQIKVWGSN